MSTLVDRLFCPITVSKIHETEDFIDTVKSVHDLTVERLAELRGDKRVQFRALQKSCSHKKGRICTHEDRISTRAACAASACPLLIR